MAEQTNIEWADSTINIWEGCQETGSPACVGCYARARNLRYAPKGTTEAPNWGPHAPRREVKSWRSTLRKISRLAAAAFAGGRTEPWFVFVNSLSDFWDNQADPKLRAEALAEFRKHPHLTFLLLTKRPQMILKLWLQAIRLQRAEQGVAGDDPSDGQLLSAYPFPRNVAIGCTVVTQAEADRDIPWLLGAAAILSPAFTFLSMEPLVEIVNLKMIRASGWARAQHMDTLTGRGNPSLGDQPPLGQSLDWVITGGGTDQGKHKAYPTPIEAFRRVRDDCAGAGVPYLHKQNGEWVAYGQHNGRTGENLGLPGPPKEDMQIGGSTMFKVGKKAAGRLLDGRTHDARPAVSA